MIRVQPILKPPLPDPPFPAFLIGSLFLSFHIAVPGVKTQTSLLLGLRTLLMWSNQSQIGLIGTLNDVRVPHLCLPANYILLQLFSLSSWV